MLSSESDISRRSVETRKDPVFWSIIRRLAFRLPFRPLLVRFYLAHRRSENFLALSLLNQLEFGGPRTLIPRERLRPPSYYRNRRHDADFRESMTAAVHRWNLEAREFV